MNAVRFFDEIELSDAEQVGGKGLSLARMARAGLPVPPGFCLTCDAYTSANGQLATSSFQSSLIEAYRRLGGGLVAVRSSATAEDGAETSFAGQQETILGVEGESALLDAVQRCWTSLHTDRAKAYRLKQGIADDAVAMAVVVQQLVPAEVAGVLFTRDPMDVTGNRMLIEASWGLGESVVSGRVTPDRFAVERESGKVLDRHVGDKSEQVTAQGVVAIDEARRKQLCLDDAQLVELAKLGSKVESFYGDPRDIEWAFVDGQFYLLQARPITTVMAVDREKVRQEEIANARKIAGSEGTVWVRYNLAEILPEPTPLTWGIVQRMLSANGGMGQMNRDLGAKPDPALGDESVYDLIAGRPYANLRKMPRMQFRKPPFRYPLAKYKANPLLALDPKPEVKLVNGFLSIFALPISVWKLFAPSMKTQKLAATFAERFRDVYVPAFLAETTEAEQRDYTSMSTDELLKQLEFWTNRTLVEFARRSLKPTVFADMSWQTLFQVFKGKLGDDRAHSALGELTLGAHPDADTDLPGAMRSVASGSMDHATFLKQFGHRGNHEMELAKPRWSEDPAGLTVILNSIPKAIAMPTANWEWTWDRIAAEAKISTILRPQMKKHAEQLRTYLGLREAGKHHLMRGYALMRRVLLALDQKIGGKGDIFFLTPAELPLIAKGESLTDRVSQRRKQRAAALSLEAPSVLFSDDLDAIGRPAPLPEGDHLQGVALSTGIAEAPALVLSEPTSDVSMSEYVLVCPSTDPSWVPLFARAKALVMETGGVLSHGAIVAREFGLPAVAGLPGVVQKIRTGQRLRVDGGRGTVSIVGE